MHAHFGHLMNSLQLEIVYGLAGALDFQLMLVCGQDFYSMCVDPLGKHPSLVHGKVNTHSNKEA